jgi:HlyD family secretion protein
MKLFQFNRSKQALLVAGVVTFSGLGFLATLTNAADATKPGAISPKPALTVTSTQAKSMMLPVTVTANGAISAWQEVIVGVEANGLRVKELHANLGDSVQGGQLLATLDAEGVQADVALARAALQEATAIAAEAAANAERTRSVQNSGVLSAQQISQYLTQEQTAKARVESAKAQLDAQVLRLKNTRVVAPDSGIVSARVSSVGAVVGAGSEMFRLIRQARLEWRAEVTPSELGRITKGTQVSIVAPDGTRWTGKVRMVSPTVDPQTRNGLVYVDVLGAASGAKNIHASLKPGMFARGDFNLGQSGTLAVPQTAVVMRDGFSFVYSLGADNRVKQRKVQTGRMQGEFLEIVSGIQAEDKLVASGAGFLSDGDLVRVVQSTQDQQGAK